MKIKIAETLGTVHTHTHTLCLLNENSEENYSLNTVVVFAYINKIINLIIQKIRVNMKLRYRQAVF